MFQPLWKVGLDPQETPPLSGVTNARKLVQKTCESRLKSLDFHQMRFRNEDVSQLHPNSAPTMSKIRLPLCTSAALLRPYCAPRTHLQIRRGRGDRPFIYKKLCFVFSSLCISHVSNPRVTLSKPAGKLEPTTLRCTTSRCYERTLISTATLFMGANVHFDIRCFLQKHPAGENKDFDSETVEKVCGNGANRPKKAQKHLAASLIQFI